MSQPFTYLFRVRYAECDPQGVVFNGRYVEYADVAFTEFVRSALGGYQELIDQGIDFQVVNLNVAWKSSAKADEVLTATVEVENIGTTSVTFTMQLSALESKRPIATIQIVYVMVDSQNYQKAPIPEGLRQQLTDGAPGVVVNHAGI